MRFAVALSTEGAGTVGAGRGGAGAADFEVADFAEDDTEEGDGTAAVAPAEGSKAAAGSLPDLRISSTIFF